MSLTCIFGLRWLIRPGVVLLIGLGTAFGLDRAFPPNLSRLATTGSEILDRQGRTVALFPAPGGVWRFSASTEDVAPVLLDTLVATEDRQFWHHPGVNPLALLRATVQDLRAGRVVSGGSTLTMQAARLLEPRPRTVRSKLIEIARAVQLEWHFSKRDILGIWLTLAPYGGNLEGVRAGSMAWFGASARNLDAAQAALLVGIPRRPEALRPDRHPDAARAVRDRILAAAGGDVPVRRLPFPRHASQAVAELAGPARVTTTLDLPLQFALERLATEQARRLPDRASLALLVVDAATREIRAVVSGGETPGESRAGSLDLTRAVRSPGSAMKPFIYAMAFEDGIAGPDTRVEDLPRHFGGYAPEDFGRGFAGGVTAGEALRRSLNLPAVALLDQVGPAQFAARLKLAGVILRLPPGAGPSLPLALGGAGITLRDLTGLYAGVGHRWHVRRAQDGPGAEQGRWPVFTASGGGGDRGGADAVAPGLERAGHCLEDRYQLGRPRLLEPGFRSPARRWRMGGSARWHTASRSDRTFAGVAIAGEGFRGLALRAAGSSSGHQAGAAQGDLVI